MGFSINPITLNYKKNRDNVAEEPFVFQPKHTPKSSITIIPNVNWLSVPRTEGSVNDRNYTIRVTTHLASLLPFGLNTAKIEFRYKYSVGGIIRKTQKEYLTVNLTIFDTVDLAISPTFLSFTYTIGQAAPQNRFVSLVSENNWNIVKDQSWITLNQTNGTGSSGLEVGVDPSGLVAGVYTGQVQVNDGWNKKILTVTLNVLGENTVDDYLLVTPDSFEWVEAFQEAATKNKKIVVESSEDFTISSNVTWITFSSPNWTAGTRSIQAVSTNTDALNYGTHQGVITVASSYSTKTIQVLLTINKTDLNGVKSGTLYFADDRNKISFTSNLDNSEMLLQYLTNNGIKQFSYPKNVPFFRGIAESILGLEAKNLIAPSYQLNNLTTRCFVPVNPLHMTIQVYDKIRSNSQQTFRETLNAIKVMTGATPKIANWLTYLPATLTTVKDAIVLFTFMSDTPPTEIQFSGASSAIYNVPLLDGGIYTCMVNLSEFNLVPGNVLNVFCSGHTIVINIKPNEPEHTKIAWLNEWNVPEMFTCSGDLEIINEVEQTLAKFAHEGKERSKVLEVSRPQVYKVNTGFILTEEEVNHLHSILDAKQIWIEIEGQFIEVTRTFKSLPYYETRNLLDAYLLTFEKATV